MHEVILLHARLDESGLPSPLADLLGRLPYAKRLELERRDPTSRRASLTGIALALAGARRLGSPAADVRCLDFPTDGKPRLRGGPGFSVAHAGLVVACAVSSSCEVGLDVECLADAAAEPGRARLRQWTATEAVLKARGLGVRHAKEVTLDERLAWGRVRDTSYVLQVVDLGPGTVACLATDGCASCVVEACPIDDAWLSTLLQHGLGLRA